MKTTSAVCLGICRGPGLGYLAFRTDCKKDLKIAAFTRDFISVPFCAYDISYEQDSPDRSYRHIVVCVPLLSVDIIVRITNKLGAVLCSKTFSPLFSKIQSRMLTLTKSDLAANMRKAGKDRSGALHAVEITEVWPGDSRHVVWRVRAVFLTSNAKALPSVDVFDNRGVFASDLADVFILEDHAVPSCDCPGSYERVLSVSLRVSKDNAGLGVRISLLGEAGCSGFAYGYPGVIKDLLGNTYYNALCGELMSDYKAWFSAHHSDSAELERQKSASANLRDAPLISIVVPVYKTPTLYLKACIESVIAQSYPFWELVLVNVSGECARVDKVLSAFHDTRICVYNAKNHSIAQNTNVGIEAATGDYVGFLDHDDVLEPDALWHYAREMIRNPKPDLLYCDEDRLRGSEFVNPAFKTCPDLTKLYSYNYVTHFLVVSRSALNMTTRSGAEVSGAQDYDLTLKVFEVSQNIVHIPRVLYHWREHEASTASGDNVKPYAHQAGICALKDHFERRGLKAQITDGVLPYTYKASFEILDPAPKVSIIIPSKDHPDLLKACVESILKKSTYLNFEVLIVENNSALPKTFLLYEQLKTLDSRVRVLCWKPEYLADDAALEGGFNYSALINFGVQKSSGEYLLFLNNDTEVIESRWIEEMISCFSRPEVGVVGAKLLFKDGLIQHAGMSVNKRKDFVHLQRNLSDAELGYGYAAGMSGEFSMVTGACQMTRRELFDELGGYDEKLAVGFNDGDYCLSAREAGYVVVYQSTAKLYHREFSSRGRESLDVNLQKRLYAEKAHIIHKHPDFFSQGDPVRNPNLDAMSDWPRLYL